MAKKAYTLVLPFVEAATRRFVKANGMREVLSLALVSGEAAIMFGPGGYAKSELTRAVLNCVEGADVFTLVCHGKMDESDLYGGIDLGAINDPDNPRIEYNTERSFLASDVFLLEEGLDAPARVLASLKNTFTEELFANGRQRRSMDTRVVLMLTNKKPADVVDVADEADRNSIAALMERFPLQIVVEWDSHKAVDFMEMFNAIDQQVECGDFSFQDLIALQEACTQVHVPHEVKMVLSELVAEAYEGGNQISPRTAVKALRLIQASAVINGRDTAVEQDIIACKYLPAMEKIASEIAQKVFAASQRAFSEELIQDGWGLFDEIRLRVERAKGPIQKLQYAAFLEQLADEVTTLIQPPSELRDRKEKLLSEINALFRRLGGETDTYLDVSVVLPERMLGTGYKVTDPQRGPMTIGEKRDWDKNRVREAKPSGLSGLRPRKPLFEDDEEEDEEDAPSFNPFGGKKK